MDNTIFQGSVLIEDNIDPSNNGYGDLTVQRNLEVQGDITVLNTVNTTIEDNVVAINFPTLSDDNIGELDPSLLVAGNDAGTIAAREESDILSDPKTLATVGAITAGAAATATLPLYAALTDPKFSTGQYSTLNFFKTWLLKMTSGAASGDVRRVISSTSSVTPVLTVDTDFSAVPSATDSFELYIPSIALYWDESAEEFAFAVEGGQHTDKVMSPLDYADIHAGGAIFEGDVNIGGDVTVPGFMTVYVTLPADAGGAGSAVNIPMVETRGSFSLLIKGDSDTVGNNPASTNGASATFLTSKSRSDLADGSNSRVTNSRGNVVGPNNTENLRIQWPAAGVIQLYHQNNPGGPGGSTITYKIRKMST